LLWAMAGADLLGTPGFRNLNGITLPTDPYGGWSDDAGSKYSPPIVNLYGMNGNQPAQTRFSPFVDLSKLQFPKFDPNAVPPTFQFTIDKLDTKPRLPSYCFLDAFHQPILYYRANTGKPAMIDDATSPFPT